MLFKTAVQQSPIRALPAASDRMALAAGI